MQTLYTSTPPIHITKTGEPKTPRKQIHAAIRKDALEWIEKKIKQGQFRSKSHALEYGVLELMKKEEQQSNQDYNSS